MSKKTVLRIQRLSRVICLLGFLVVLGTAGASDCDLIPLKQILKQSVVGLVMFGGGALFGGMLG